MADLKRVEFNDIKIGDHAWVEIAFNGNPLIRTIPRAEGVKIYSTGEMGGGVLNIIVHAWVKKDTRKELEQYFQGLPASLGQAKATLKFENIELTNCVLSSIIPPGDYHKYSFFTVSFIKSI